MNKRDPRCAAAGRHIAKCACTGDMRKRIKEPPILVAGTRSNPTANRPMTRAEAIAAELALDEPKK